MATSTVSGVGRMFSKYLEECMLTPGTAPDLNVDQALVVGLYPHDTATKALSDAIMDDVTGTNQITTLASLNTETGGSVANANHGDNVLTLTVLDGGNLDAADTVLAGPAAGAASNLLLYHLDTPDTTPDLTTPPAGTCICYWINSGAAMVTPNGSQITIQWNASGLFKLG